MNKLLVKGKVSVKEARRVFADESEHDDFGILGYYRIVLAVYGLTNNYVDNTFSAERIDRLLTSLRANYQQIIWLRFWCCNTLQEIGDLAEITKESVRQIQNKALKRLELSKDEFLEANINVVAEKKKEISKALKCRKTINSDIPISMLRLSVRLNNALKAANIFTIGELLCYSKKELLDVKNIGPTSIKQINCELDKFISGLKIR